MKTRALKISENLAGCLFILPWIIGFCWFVIGPMMYSLYVSFTQWEFLKDPVFVGLKNYRKIFIDDPHALYALGRTGLYTIIAIPLQLLFSLLLAMLLNTRKTRGLRVYRAIIYLPSVISGSVLGILWASIYQKDFGLFNYLLSLVNIDPVGWLTDPSMAMGSVIVMNLFSIGVPFVMFLAALQNVPNHLYESASIDGASSLQKTIHITLPMLTPVILFVAVILLIGSFQILTPILVLTDGGPARATYVYALHEYQMAFEYLKMGYASALSWFMFIIIMTVTALVMRSSDSWVHYETSRD